MSPLSLFLNFIQESRISIILSMSYRQGFNPPFLVSIIITVVLVLIYRLGVQIQIPFINTEAAQEIFKTYSYFDPGYIGRFSIFSLGLMPYVSSYLMVEICSLFIPFLKKLRTGDYQGRQKLKKIALILTLPLGVLQGSGIVTGLTDTISPGGAKFLEISGSYEYIMLVAVLVGGLYFLIFITELISKFGFGHGISIIILSGICADLSSSAIRNLGNFSKIELNMLLLLAAIFSIIVVSTIVLLRTKISILIYHRSSEKSLNAFQFNTCPSGKIAIGYAGSIIMLPVTIFSFFDTGHPFINYFRPGSVLYNVLSVVLIFVLSYVLAVLFLHPKRRIVKLKQRGWEFPEIDENFEKFLVRKLVIYNLPWTLFLCVLVVMPSIQITIFEYPFFIGGISLYIAVVIGLDILDRYSVQLQTPSGQLVKIAEFHDIYDSSMIKKHLRSEGVPCHLQGFYHRHLYYFFGPYLDISLMVGNDKAEFCRDIIKNFYNGLGLIKN
jgi:preprotein translocase subunit SecY